MVDIYSTIDIRGKPYSGAFSAVEKIMTLKNIVAK